VLRSLHDHGASLGVHAVLVVVKDVSSSCLHLPTLFICPSYQIHSYFIFASLLLYSGSIYSGTVLEHSSTLTHATSAEFCYLSQTVPCSVSN
jgi:hypothetical protein